MNLPGTNAKPKANGFFPFSFKKKKNELPKSALPKIKTKIVPGPKSKKLAETLRRYECPQITFVSENFPVFLKRANACNLIDVDDNRYLDLSSAFSVVNLGHGNTAVLEALKNQAKEMLHGMGDVHPNEVKVLLAKKLSEITPGNLNHAIFSSTGAEAVESALKTAAMHTKKPGVIAFTGAYHGLLYGALSVTHRDDFKAPFNKQLGNFAYHAPYPDTRLYGNQASQISLKAVQKIIKKAKRSKFPVGAVLLEVIQGRGGIVAAPQEFLKGLRALCDEEQIVMITDEVFTGFGRTGSMFAIEKSGLVPDIMCLGKGLGNGFPISACVGKMRVMFSWGASTGDAIHTSTFLGHPTGCAVALAVIQEIEQKKLADRSKLMGDFFRKELWKLKEKYPMIADVRGAGLMIGIEFSHKEGSGKKEKIVPDTDKTRRFMLEALKNGLVLLPSAPDHNVISITPPLIISEREITHCVQIFDKILKNLY